MKKLAYIPFVFLLFVFSCFEGYVSKDGKALKKYLPPAKLKHLIDDSDATTDAIIIIDVRPSSNYKAGHIPTAKSFPSSEVMSRLDELPKDKSLIVYCETGGRAQAVIKMLEKKGYTKMLNWGGYTRWPYDLLTD